MLVVVCSGKCNLYEFQGIESTTCVVSELHGRFVLLHCMTVIISFLFCFHRRSFFGLLIIIWKRSSSGQVLLCLLTAMSWHPDISRCLEIRVTASCNTRDLNLEQVWLMALKSCYQWMKMEVWLKPTTVQCIISILIIPWRKKITIHSANVIYCLSCA